MDTEQQDTAPQQQQQPPNVEPTPDTPAPQGTDTPAAPFAGVNSPNRPPLPGASGDIGTPPPLPGSQVQGPAPVTPPSWDDFTSTAEMIFAVLRRNGPDAAKRLQDWIKSERSRAYAHGK